MKTNKKQHTNTYAAIFGECDQNASTTIDNVQTSTSTITVNNCNGFENSQEAIDIASNELTALNLLAKAISTYNSNAQLEQKYEMGTFSIDQRCYQDSSNGELKYGIGACTIDSNPTIDMDKFNNVSINFISANEYTITYDIISQ